SRGCPVAHHGSVARVGDNGPVMNDHPSQSRVAAERAATVARIASLDVQHRTIVEGSRWTTDDDEHDPEGSTIAFERAAIASMIRDARDELRELDQAQDRLDRGVYGECEVCGSVIAQARLDAVPAARRCIDCTSRRR
ncbi:MAG: TraR/DksA C4-type zinc finger protein, partial [Rhodococcus sp. (in: high G+C Gram-positive bacteria)]